MAKKKQTEAKLSAKAAKKAKLAARVEHKAKKGQNKGKGKADEEDLESILEQMRQEWEQAHSVTEELVEGPPSRRANATLTTCPTGNYLWFIGGEFFGEDRKAYNDIFRYSPEKNEWRKFVSPTCPGPRSAHAVAVTHSGGGKLFLFGGEFSSQNQITFYHYGDFWCFDVSAHSWDRIETRIGPSPRSGHRMTVWKHYIVLFGGFYDPGITTRYLNDLWVFDTLEYEWRLIEFKVNETRPSPRSGFSFLSTPEGIVLHGGYCKEYSKGKRPIGIMLDDTWILKMSLVDPAEASSSSSSKPNTSAPISGASNKSKKSSTAGGSKSKANPLVVKWERRKRPSTAYAPSLRSGCTMTSWINREMGVMFGGVTDEDTSEETLESVFWNDLNGYQWNGKGRWVSMPLRNPKKKARGGKKKAAAETAKLNDASDSDDESAKTATPLPPSAVSSFSIVDYDPDDPILSTPLPRYNAMLAVLKNTLYIYGGIFERGSREYTLDDFYSIQLDKMDRFVCLKESEVVIEEGGDESDEDESDDEEDEDEDEDENELGLEDAIDSDDEEIVEGKEIVKKYDDDDSGEEDALVGREDDNASTSVTLKKETDSSQALRSQVNAFIGVSKDTSRSPEDIFSTPLPGETLAMFYSRSRGYWSQKANNSENAEARGKRLRTVGFGMAEQRYAEYKPILQEAERMLAEAGLNEEEMRKSAAGRGGDIGGQNRNRR